MKLQSTPITCHNPPVSCKPTATDRARLMHRSLLFPSPSAILNAKWAIGTRRTSTALYQKALGSASTSRSLWLAKKHEHQHLSATQSHTPPGSCPIQSLATANQSPSLASISARLAL